MRWEGSVELLLVEDDLRNEEVTPRALQSHRLANCVHVVRDGAEALDFLFCQGAYAERRVDDGPKVVLLDLKLPKVGGVEVLRRLREDPRTRAVPVVVLTSSRKEPDLAESYRLGGNSYVVKPVDFNRFVEAVGELGIYWLLLSELPT